MEAEDALRPGERGREGGLQKALEIDSEIVAFRAEGVAVLGESGNGFAADEEQAVYERVAVEQRRPTGLDRPCKSRTGVVMFERGERRQGMNDVAHSAEPDDEDAAVSGFG